MSRNGAASVTYSPHKTATPESTWWRGGCRQTPVSRGIGRRLGHENNIRRDALAAKTRPVFCARSDDMRHTWQEMGCQADAVETSLMLVFARGPSSRRIGGAARGLGGLQWCFVLRLARSCLPGSSIASATSWAGSPASSSWMWPMALHGL